MTAPSSVVAKVVARRTGASRSSILGVVASLALVIGYFLPWSGLSSTLGDSLGIDAKSVVRSAERSGEKRTIDIAGRLKDGAALTGSEWTAVLDAVAEKGDLDGMQQRGLEVAQVGVLVLPYAAGLLALLLLLHSISPARAMKLGVAPLAGLLALLQSRLFDGLLRIVTMAIAIVVLSVTGLLWLGARVLSEAETATGLGIALMAGGGGFAFLSGFVGYGPGRLRAVLWAVLLIAALVITGLVLAGRT